MQQRISWVYPILYFITQHLHHRREDVNSVGQPCGPLSVFKPARSMDDQRYPYTLLVGGIPMHEATMLAEALTVIAEDDEDGVLVEPKPLVLIEEVLQKVVQHPKAVVVAVEILVLGEGDVPVAVGDALVAIVPCACHVLGHKRLVPVGSKPPLARS